MTACVRQARNEFLRDIARFPRVERDGYGLRPGVHIELVEITPRGLKVIVRLPGWDEVDLFGDRDDDEFELTTEVPWDSFAHPAGLSLPDVANAVRESFGWAAYADAFQI